MGRKLCRRCLQSFEDGDNTPSSCRHHPQAYVCRKHDLGANYYSVHDAHEVPEEHRRLEEWDGKFWDCCGAEAKDAPGCAVSAHVSFDDRA